ncbi:hypothetical protein NJH83_14640 [Pseudomonas chlororaphis]|uniref:hypothetical protein n=1 Tax=Pseudomonas chlororaphis TaxID=587753 RepID=UPI00209A7291|nr:hypothetical protein [Pseudomonas chlororaphis]MCO7611473.1 hypothetical protein [Pseudomonas chlororaphis]
MCWGVSSDAQLINFAVEAKYPVQLIQQGFFRYDVDGFEKQLIAWSGFSIGHLNASIIVIGRSDIVTMEQQ